MSNIFRIAMAVAGLGLGAQAAAQVTLYEHDDYGGRSVTTDRTIVNLGRVGFNDRSSSAVVRGTRSQRWEVCEDRRFQGRCMVLVRGAYPNLSAMGLGDRISSVRPVGGNARLDDGRFAPQPAPAYDYGRRPSERIYQAEITSVRAVMDNPGQRCWVERGQVTQEREGANVPGAILGAVIGGVLGHQIGGGSGRDLATGIGVVAGAAIGGNSGRADGQQVVTRDVRRCEGEPGGARPAYWDVTYQFRGVEHRMQMTRRPGATVSVNARGEPRA
jgi:uncharacterized protein YcfJ